MTEPTTSPSPVARAIRAADRATETLSTLQPNGERIEQYARVVVPSAATMLGLLVAFLRDIVGNLTGLGRFNVAIAVAALAGNVLLASSVALYYGPLSTPERATSPIGKRTRHILVASIVLLAIGVASYTLIVIEVVYTAK